MIRPGEVLHGMCKCLCEFIALGYGPVHVEKPMSVGGPVHTYRTRSQVE